MQRKNRHFDTTILQDFMGYNFYVKIDTEDGYAYRKTIGCHPVGSGIVNVLIADFRCDKRSLYVTRGKTTGLARVRNGVYH